MKTSLNIENRLFLVAKHEAERKKSTVSELISYWARVGYETLKKEQKNNKPKKHLTADLGGEASIDLSSRRIWLDEIDG